MSDAAGAMRWDPYVLASHGGFDAFWSKHLAETPRRLLLIVGRGFDPRAHIAAARLTSLGARPDVWFLGFDDGSEDSARRTAMSEANDRALRALPLGGTLIELRIKVGLAAQTQTSRNVLRAMKQAGGVAGYDDIVVDVSAMPRMVALTAVARLLHDLDKADAEGRPAANLHVVAAESVSADIGSAGGTLNDKMSTVVSFSGELTAEGSESQPRVWFPILGEGQHSRLRALQEVINPDEICPVIPFPTRDPRRGDRIIEEYRELLFDEMNVEPRNILHACEYNPFEAYKQIFNAMARYSQALAELGGCKAFVSPLSSKLLSIGALLACYDHSRARSAHLRVGIPYLETAVYGDPVEGSLEGTELFSMWIRGEWER